MNNNQKEKKNLLFYLEQQSYIKTFDEKKEYQDMCKIAAKGFLRELQFWSEQIELFLNNNEDYLGFSATFLFPQDSCAMAWTELEDRRQLILNYCKKNNIDFVFGVVEIHRIIKSKLKKKIDDKDKRGELIKYPHLHFFIICKKQQWDEFNNFIMNNSLIWDYELKKIGDQKKFKKDLSTNIFSLIKYIVKEYRIQHHELIFKELNIKKWILYYNTLKFLNDHKFRTILEQSLIKNLESFTTIQETFDDIYFTSKSFSSKWVSVIEYFLLRKNYKLFWEENEYVTEIYLCKPKENYIFVMEKEIKGPNAIYSEICKFFAEIKDTTRFDFITTEHKSFYNILDFGKKLINNKYVIDQWAEFFEFSDGHQFLYRNLDDLHNFLNSDKTANYRNKITSTQEYTHKYFKISKKSLIEKLKSNTVLKNFKIFIKNPNKTDYENDKIVYDFLKLLGKYALDNQKFNYQGLILFGEQGTGKTPFVHKIIDRLFGTNKLVNWVRTSSHGSAQFKKGKVIFIDEAKNESLGILNQLKEYTCGNPITINEKGKPMEMLDISDRIFVMASNHTPEQIFRKEEEVIGNADALYKRFPHRYQLFHKPGRDFNFEGLISEFDEMIFLGIALNLANENNGSNENKDNSESSVTVNDTSIKLLDTWIN